MPIHTAPEQIKEMAKYEVERTMQQRYRLGLADIPFITGIGIGDAHIVITVEDEIPWNYREFIPTEVARIPVYVRNVGPAFRESPGIDGNGFYYQMQQRGQAGVAQSGAVIHGRESGSLFDVLLDAQGQKYAVCSSHVLAPTGTTASIGGRQIGKVVKDLRHCNGSSRVDAAAVLLSQGVNANPTMLGLNVRCVGFVKPAVGMTISTSGSNSGTTTQKINTINYSFRNDTGGNCPTNFQDLWIGSVRSKPGDSGSNMVTKQQDGKYYSVGILTTNNGQGSVNCSSWYMQQEFGITKFLGA
jgi:hypothetical protein